MRFFLEPCFYKKLDETRGDARDPADEPTDDLRAGGADDTPVRCANCGHEISHSRHRIEVAGRHQHTCINPAGVVYRISCYRHAPGCVPDGERSDHYSWFAAHSWQVARCGGCEIHLGWAFFGDDDGFHGLVTRLLTSSRDDG